MRFSRHRMSHHVIFGSGMATVSMETDAHTHMQRPRLNTLTTLPTRGPREATTKGVPVAKARAAKEARVQKVKKDRRDPRQQQRSLASSGPAKVHRKRTRPTQAQEPQGLVIDVKPITRARWAICVSENLVGSVRPKVSAQSTTICITAQESPKASCSTI